VRYKNDICNAEQGVDLLGELYRKADKAENEDK